MHLTAPTCQVHVPTMHLTHIKSKTWSDLCLRPKLFQSFNVLQLEGEKVWEEDCKQETVEFQMPRMRITYPPSLSGHIPTSLRGYSIFLLL